MKPMKLTADVFTWTGPRGVAECSDLGISATTPLPTLLEVISPKTGKALDFFYAGLRQDDEGEYLSWTYRAKAEGFNHLSIVLLND